MANYISESWSADLDFGTGEFSLAAWVSVPFSVRRNTFVSDTQTFAGWGGGNLNITANAATAPDGTLSAATFIPNGANAFHETYTSGNATSGINTLSVEAKAAGYNYLFLFVGTGANAVAVFNLATGVLDNVSGSAAIKTTSIVATSNGYYKCTLTASASTASTAGFTISNTSALTTYSGDGVSGIYFWHPQCENTVFATAYQRVYGGVGFYGNDAVIAERRAASGPYIRLQALDGNGPLTATAFDGTTTRSVTTPAAYNTGIFTKVRATYTAAGKLAITVNGVEVASATGTPLLSMSAITKYNLATATENVKAGPPWGLNYYAIEPNALACGSGPAFLTKITASSTPASTEYRMLAPAGAFSASFYVHAGTRTGLDLLIRNATSGASLVGNSMQPTGALANTSWSSTSVGNNIFRVSVAVFSGFSTGDVLEVYFGATGAVTAGQYWYVSGMQVTQGSALLAYQRVNLANDYDSTLTIGNSRTLDAPFPGSITLLKLGATVPTPEQATFMYEQEKHMFRSDAQITLPASSAVLDLAYDDAQDKWVAVQAGYESSFTGLIRTNAAVPSAGSFGKVVAGGGVKALTRTTTNPGVDIVIPAYGMREELVRRAEAAAKASKTLTVFDFDAVAGQTDFVLPVGWTAASVVSAGNTRREGATKEFVRQYDGFRETIRFAVAPGAAVWVRINAVKE